jgi:hypothetical protein
MSEFEVQKIREDLSKELEEKLNRRFDAFSSFVKETYGYASDSIRNTMLLGGILLLVASVYGIKSLSDIDPKVQAVVDEKLRSAELRKKIDESSLKERRLLLTADLQQRILSARLKRQLRQIGDLGLSGFLNENLDDIAAILNSEGKEPEKLLSLLNEALTLDPPMPAQKERWAPLAESIRKLRTNGKSAKLVREAYRFEISYLGDNEAQELLKQLNGVLKNDSSVPSAISDNAKYYLLLLASNSGNTGNTYKDRLRKLCDAASAPTQTDPEWLAAGMIAKGWVDNLNTKELDDKLGALSATPQGRKNLVNFLGRQGDFIFRGYPFSTGLYGTSVPSPTFTANLFWQIYEDGDSKEAKRSRVAPLASLSSAPRYFQEFATEVLEKSKNADDLVEAVQSLISEEFLFLGRNLSAIPVLYVITRTNPVYQQAVMVTQEQEASYEKYCDWPKAVAEDRAANKGTKPPNTAPVLIITETCQKLGIKDVRRWRVFFRTNYLYEQEE